MQAIGGINTIFSQNSFFSDIVNKPWKVVALTVAAVAFLALGATYAIPIISNSTAFAITCVTASIGTGYLIFKNCFSPKKTWDKDLKNIMVNQIIASLKTAMIGKVDEEMVLFGYSIENEANEKPTQEYERFTNTNQEEIINQINDTLLTLLHQPTYTENSKIEIELLILSKLEQDPSKTTNEFVKVRTFRGAYKGLESLRSSHADSTEILEYFLDDLPKGFKIIQVDRSNWNADGTFV